MRCPLSVRYSRKRQSAVADLAMQRKTHALNGEIMLKWPSQLANMYFMLFLQICIHLTDKHEVISENLENVCFISLETLLLHLHIICICAFQNHFFKENTIQRIFIKNILSCLQCVVLTNFVDLSGWKTCSQVGKQFY